MKVSVLVENTSKNDLNGEHGLSFHIEHDGVSYLLDTGKSNLYLKNAEAMGIDLSSVDIAFLSHGHYDHSGGFDEFFNINDKSEVFLQRACKENSYYKIIGSVKKYIGIPKGVLEKHDGRFRYVDGFKQVNDGVFICPHTTDDLSVIGEHAHMYSKVGNDFVVDDFNHEQTIVFEQEEGLYLFNSCSHGGVDNIINEIQEFFPNKEICGFFGGFHMMGVNGVNSCSYSENEVRDIARRISKATGATFFTGHCTGSIASKWLKEELGERLVELYTGMSIDL